MAVADIKMFAVLSSNIRAIGYDEGEQVLQVLFKNGTLYRYGQVPKDVYEAFLKSPSKGAFFSKVIRNTFEFLKIATVPV